MNRLFITAVILAGQLLLSACVQQPAHQPESASVTGADSQAVAAAERPTQSLLIRQAVDKPTLAAFERATRAMVARDWPTALAELEPLVERHPELSGPCLNLAIVYQARADAPRAEQFFHRALQVNPDNLVAYNQYGIFLREQGRFAEAEQVYLQALSVWEAHPDTHRNLGVLYDLYMGDHTRALDHFNRYQDLTGAGDPVVASWIVDLQRQRPSLAQGADTI